MAGVGMGQPASAHEDPEHEPAEITAPDGSVGIGDGIFLKEGVVIPPEREEPSSFDAYHTAVFVQSWLAAAFYGGQEIVQDPPPDLPVYRIDSTGEWSGNSGTVTAYFATDGTTPYIAFPGMVVWNDPSQIPPPSNWFVAPPRVIDAFNGVADLVPSLGVEAANSTTTLNDEKVAADSAGDGSSDTETWPWIVVAATALAGGSGALWLRRRAPAV